MMSDIKRTIVVTGGSKGIGRAICTAFASPDTCIYFNFSSPQAAGDETAAHVSAAGGIPRPVRVNVASEKEVCDFFKTVVHETGRIDVLVNNAGITRDNLLFRIKEKDWDDVIDVNLKGTFNCTREAAKTMVRQRSGRIINITSIAGVAGNPGQSNYAASKAGVVGFTKAVARELASRNITVNAIAPGYIETGLTLKLPETTIAGILSQIPLGRAGTPQNVADLAVFLASDRAGYITGQVIHVNGGMYM
jgi:3-oxoacyl-[acyl-carrier protein] reductase